MSNLPREFCDMASRLAVLEPRVDGLVEALESTEPAVSVRFNPRKRPVALPPAAEPVEWWPDGYYLSERPQFTLDPAMHQGRYYVQDASSMYIARILSRFDTPVAYLDACAAPGGKTTAALDALPEGSLVVANEFDFRRAEILKENITKWGAPGVMVTRGDTARFQRLTNTFDIIAADVPCSGEGMMRKDAGAVAQWSPALVKQCAERQRRIIDNLWGALRPGGYFIYSTCTFNLDENEHIVRYIIDTYGAESISTEPHSPAILPAIGGDPDLHACRFMPHLTRGEGLFIALLRKPGTAPGASRAIASGKTVRQPRLPFKLPPWWPESLEPLLEGDTLYAVEPRWRQLVDTLCRQLDVIMPGVEIATLKGRDLIPAQGAAMLAGMEMSAAVPRVEIDRDDALTFLRREALTLPAGVPRGFILLTHGNLPLGWVKNLGSRTNNLYPMPWRIRHL